MKAEQLVRYIQNPQNITATDMGLLKELIQQYPYFQLAYSLIAKGAHDSKQPHAAHTIQAAAIYATNRKHLKALLENKDPFFIAATQPAAQQAPIMPEKVQQEKSQVEEQGFFINDYIESISKRAAQKTTKQKSLTQFNMIQAVLQKGLRFDLTAVQDLSEETFQVDLTNKSTTFHDAVITETLAQMMCKQGKIKRAIEIYEKLILKFPEKKAYFVAIIAELENKE